ncbi:MAG: trigger factor [Pseudomonadota bacterium]
MQVSVEITSSVERKLIVGVPSNEVDALFTDKLKDLSKTVRLSGYRKGKVPLTEIGRRYGKTVRRDVVTEIINKYYFQALTDQKLDPVGNPTIERVVDEPGADFKFEALVQVYPEFDLPDLTEIEVKIPTCDVSDADVEKVIEDIRGQNAKWVDSESSATALDRVTIDFKGSIDGEIFEGGTAENFVLELGKNKMIPGFEEPIVGLTAGDSKTFPVKFPDEYPAEALKGKAAEFAITVKKVEQALLPELNEEFIVQILDVESGNLEEAKKQIREVLEQQSSNALKQVQKKAILEAIAGKTSFTIPNQLTRQQARQMRDQFLNNLNIRGKNKPNFSEEVFFPEAEKQVRYALLVRKIVADNKLQPNNDRVGEILQEIYRSLQSTDMQNSETQNAALQHAYALSLDEQAIDMLQTKLKLVYEPIELPELMKQNQ